MDEPLEELYFQWLYGQIGSVKQRNRARSYWQLARVLHKREFIWFVPNDDNRVEDGRELRYEFARVSGNDDVSEEWFEVGCSFLEMLIALSRRLAFESEGEPADWFWTLVDKNLHIRVNDRDWTRDHERDINNIVDRVIWRRYSRTGVGGLFPLKHTTLDQRKVEIWYQLSAYLIEHEE